MSCKNKKEYMKQYRERNKERLKGWAKNYRKKNVLRIKKYMKQYRKDNAEQISRKKKEWRKKNKQKIKKQNRIYKSKNPNKIKKWKQAENLRRKLNGYNKTPKVRESKEKWRRKNKGYNKRYYEKNKETLLKKQYKRDEKRIKEDKNYAIQKRLRGMLRSSLKLYTKEGKVYNSKKYDVDYKAIIDYLKPTIPKDFLSSDKKYHIHHIKPLCSFKFINKKGSINFNQIKKAFKPENHKIVTEQEHKKLHKKRKNNINQHYIQNGI